MKTSQGEYFRPRGIGSNWIPCFVCGIGGEGTLLPDMASFVDGHDGGKRVETMIRQAGYRCFLDFRPSEPEWVQVKLGACTAHFPCLERLADLIIANNCYINEEILKEAVEGETTPEAVSIALHHPFGL
jgi:hypothetical protein